jgi:hypothetical protein
MADLLDKSLQHFQVLQNISAIDRLSRIVIGMAMIGIWLFSPMQTVSVWTALLPLTGALVALSGILGWCPVYALFGTRSCGTDAHNACGTLPFQLSRLFRHPD